MAYSDMYDNNKQKNKLYDRPTTNGLVFENPNSTVDPSRIKISYWNNMIKLVIEPKLNNGSQIPEWDKTNSIAAFITPARAMTLLEAIKKLETEESTKSAGVLCKESMLKISKGHEFGKPGMYIVIEKVAGRDDLTPISTYIYECGGSVNEYLIQVDGSSQFVPVELIDYEFIKVTLAEFVTASTGAIASSVCLENSYNANHTKEYLRAIAQNLGVEIQTAPTGGRTNGVPGRTPGGNIPPRNNSSFGEGAMNPPAQYSGNVEDDLLG